MAKFIDVTEVSHDDPWGVKIPVSINTDVIAKIGSCSEPPVDAEGKPLRSAKILGVLTLTLTHNGEAIELHTLEQQQTLRNMAANAR